MRLLKKFGFVKINTKFFLFDYHTPLVLNHWTHYCVVLTEFSMEIFKNGKVTFSNEKIKGGLQLDNILPDFIQYTSLGVHKHPFNGWLTRVNMWSQALNSSQVEQEAKCNLSDPEPNILAWSTAELVVGDTVTVTQMEGCPGDLREEITNYPFYHKLKFEAAMAVCSSLGGGSWPPETEAELGELQTLFVTNQSRCQKYWIPGIRSNERYHAPIFINFHIHDSGGWISMVRNLLLTYHGYLDSQMGYSIRSVLKIIQQRMLPQDIMMLAVIHQTNVFTVSYHLPSGRS